MGLRYIYVVIALLMSSFGAVVASNVSSLPIRKVGDVSYYVYDVTARESVYAVSKKLDISVSELIKYNPSAEDGLNKGQKLFFPVPDSVISENSNVVVPAAEAIVNDSEDSSVIYHTLQSGETLYRLSLKYSTTLDEIIRLNPSLSPNNYKANDVIKIIPNTITENDGADNSVTGFIAHKADRGDSYKSIAKDYGVEEELVKETNQDLDEVKRGNYIYIPTELDNDIDTLEMERKSKLEIDSIYNSMQRNVDDIINIALILPFGLDAKVVPSDGVMFTEFYKGFILAVDSLSDEMNRKVNLYAYDSAAGVKEILAETTMLDMDLIFTSNNNENIELISKYANENNINVVNLFSTKTENYIDENSYFQANIPQSYMFSKTLDYVSENFKDYQFVFVTDANSEDEKKAIIPMLNELAMLNGKYPPIELLIDDKNSVVGLDSIMGSKAKKVMLIPTSASRLTLMKVLFDLNKYNVDTNNSNFVLFGHPEWVTYKDMYNLMNKYNSYVYTRFFCDTNDYRYIDFSERFIDSYGKIMKSSYPNFAILGFDAGIYFLSALDEHGGNFNDYNVKYNGVQNDFLFERVNNWGGFVNQSTLIINFKPDMNIKRITLF